MLEAATATAERRAESGVRSRLSSESALKSFSAKPSKSSPTDKVTKNCEKPTGTLGFQFGKRDLQCLHVFLCSTYILPILEFASAAGIFKNI